MSPPDQDTRLLGNENNATKNSHSIIMPENGMKNSNSITSQKSNPENGKTTIVDNPEMMNESNDEKLTPIEKSKMATTAYAGKAPADRETWDKKLDFLLSVIGFAVDLGNVWRFPTICYQNGGGAFLLPYIIMLIFGGLPLFYMELALGQFQRCGCISVWSRICPMFKGIGFSICVIASYVAMYYNTIISWAVYFLFASFRFEVPWATCGHDWNTDNCRREVVLNSSTFTYLLNNQSNADDYINQSLILSRTTIYGNVSPAEEYFERRVLEVQNSRGLDYVGNVKWSLCLCLMLVFLMVYFSLWKGIKSSGKAVWVTATLPYIVLLILLVRGVTLPGAEVGIKYYLTPVWAKLKEPQVWTAAAAQIFFSLGPGFGVLLALSSYNKFNNNCYKDALITASINCATSFLAGFVVFSVLGYMSVKQGVGIQEVAKEGPGLVFIVYPEAISTLTGSTFWSIIFFLMLITLGLDSTFGGLEALITGVCDEWPWIGKKREVFVAALITYCFLGALGTTTYGGSYVVTLLDNHAAPISILFICFLEAIAVSWFYGVNRFSDDLEKMFGFRPGIFWRVCWAVISPAFLIVLFIMSFVFPIPLEAHNYVYPPWSKVLGWVVTCSSIIPIPIYMIYRFIKSGMSFSRDTLDFMIKPEKKPKHLQDEEDGIVPTFL